jgi:DNA (cytosine-5)-methyltransferase 1
MYELELFSGAGGGILGGMLCGHTCIGAVEIEEYPRKVLLQRQRDGILPHFPIWDDITTFRADNPETAEYIKLLQSIREQLIISGGFPCQDISAAGTGAGIASDTRSGLWYEMARVIDEIRPARVRVENSPMLTSRGLGIVLGDLAEMGYDAEWGVLGADDVGAPHKRKRIWIMAYTNNTGQHSSDG